MKEKRKLFISETAVHYVEKVRIRTYELCPGNKDSSWALEVIAADSYNKEMPVLKLYFNNEPNVVYRH